MLVTHLAARGRLGPGSVVLRRPLDAWRTFAANRGGPTKAAIAGGGARSAIEIQRHYLEAVSRRLGELPAWAPELATRWGEALDHLDAGRPPDWLEWPRRLGEFERVIRSEPSWRDLAEWNDRWPAVLREAGVEAGDDPIVVEQALERWAARQGGGASGALAYHRVRRAIVEREAELDRVSGGGSDLFSTDQLTRAMTSGPTDTRAAARSKWIRRLGATEQRARFRAAWHGVWDLVAGTWIDLADPNVAQRDWQPIGGSAGQGDLFAGFRDWLERL